MIEEATTGALRQTIRLNLTPILEAKVFTDAFFDAYGENEWQVDDANRTASHQFRTELISRIATARLAYGSGTEKRALKSISELFQRAREITSSNVGCGTFEVLVWHTLNSHVRPFTAKWHPLSENGALEALDSSDDFRAELYEVQSRLRELERALAGLDNLEALYNPGRRVIDEVRAEPIKYAEWRPAGGHEEFGASERAAVLDRRNHYQIRRGEWAAGLALSGGGIRSATFSLGVLSALSRRNLLPEFDYLSTVSGGGYAGCFVTSLLGRPELPDNLGLSASQEPFRRLEQESELLMGVRQKASFLSSGALERVLVVMRSTYGVFVHTIFLCGMLAYVAAAELIGRQLLDHPAVSTSLGWFFPISSLIVLSFVSRMKKLELDQLTAWHLLIGAMFSLPLVWIILGTIHSGIALLSSRIGAVFGMDALAGAILIGTISLALIGAISAVYAQVRTAAGAVLAVMFLIFVEHSFFTIFYHQTNFETGLGLLIILALLLVLWWWVDVNETSLYRYYRSKLATAFIYAHGAGASPKISDFDPKHTFFPIVNCALNAPGSKLPAMRGRLADIFAFTPQMTGCKIVGYSRTKTWESQNPGLDLAAIMALSGAAVSPQMGLRTTLHGSFWLTLFNARLSAWLRNPEKSGPRAAINQSSLLSNLTRSGPGFDYLFREFTATADENLEYVNISDGGHIENLGVYELLRRHCRYIVAIDGENDPRMTFHALTNLQRLAYIDLGIHIDAELDEMRLQVSGFSRSHFRFCRIRYPCVGGSGRGQVGYLLYLKLSLTGNEGEFLRRYRLDEPAFPHHSTADQFFSETQFEAYRSLGEHIGDKLFMKAIIEKLADAPAVRVDDWMQQYAKNFLNE